MHNRIKRLEELVNGASELIVRLKEENEVLKKQVELLGAARNKAVSNSAAARELAASLDKEQIVVINLSGRGDKDLDIVTRALEARN